MAGSELGCLIVHRHAFSYFNYPKMTTPANPKLYHIVHLDRLSSILEDGCLWCDAEVVRRNSPGTMIGMSHIKQRRLDENVLMSHFGLMVGDCVPFYFCPRSIMLFLIHKGNPDLAYKGGQGPILHLVTDLQKMVRWADETGKRWAFTLSNAGSSYFEDRADLSQLEEINWEAIRATKWSGTGVRRSIKEGKQAEFLVESSVPWELVEHIGVYSRGIAQEVHNTLAKIRHRPEVDVHTNWYY